MEKLRFETKAIKSVENHLSDARPVSNPIYLSTTYHRNEDGSFNHDLAYTREGNPNRLVLEHAIAQLEGGNHGFAFSSGMAAIHAVFQSLKAGDHVILPDDTYYHTTSLVKNIFQQWNLSHTSVDMSDIEKVKDSIQENTALIWIETPSNPQLKISDISKISMLCKENGLLLAVDNTWPTPVLQRPFELGADIIMHSTTKYFGGHSDVLGGCLVVKDKELANKFEQIQTLSGGVPSPFDCWLIARGIQTLHLRVKAQTETAFQLAQFLESHPKIESVNYPGLESHPQHEVAKSQMSGFGAMLSVLIKGDRKRTFEVANKLELFTKATSLGGTESLLEHRKSVEGEQSPTPDNLLRISVGLEHIEDMKADWDRALA